MSQRLSLVALLFLLAVITPLPAEPPRYQIEHRSAVTCLAWSSNGQRLATGASDGTVRVFESATGKEVQSFATGDAILGMAFSPDGNSLALSQFGQSLSTWDVATGRRQRQNALKNYKAEHLAFTPDGQTVVGVSLGEFQQWKLVGGASASKMANPGSGHAAISPDGRTSGWVDAKGQLRLREYQPNTSTTLQVGAAHSMALGPEGRLLAIGGSDHKVHIWDLQKRQKTKALTGLQEPAVKLSLSSDGKTLAGLASDGTTIRVWDLTRDLTRRQINHNRGPAGALNLSPDGKMLATTGLDGKALLLWNVATRELTHKGQPLKLSAEELVSLWNELGGADYKKADAAWHKLAAAGDHAIAFLQEQVRPIIVPPVDMRHIEQLLDDLDAERYATRERASKELLSAGELAIVPLQRLLNKNPSGEAERRATLILQKLAEPVLTPERMRVLEAIELLEQVRTTKAIGLLEEIERDTLIAQIRREARQSLQRVAQSQDEKR